MARFSVSLCPDYFGTPVQLAAHVMSKAESDEITVSHIVQTMYTGKDISLKNVGQFDLKGVRRTDG